MKWLLDTDYVIDYLSGQQAAITLIDSLRLTGAAISVITRAEIMEGILSSRDPKIARTVFRDFLSSPIPYREPRPFQGIKIRKRSDPLVTGGCTASGDAVYHGLWN